MYRYIQMITKWSLCCLHNLSWKWKSASASMCTGMYRCVPVRIDTFQCVRYITLFVQSKMKMRVGKVHLCVPICIDTYRYVWIRTDVYRYVWIRTDVYRYVSILWDILNVHYYLFVQFTLRRYVSIRTDVYRYKKLLFILHPNQDDNEECQSMLSTDTHRYVSMRTGMYRCVPVCIDAYRCVSIHITVYPSSKLW